jgi:hypothetical protein
MTITSTPMLMQCKAFAPIRYAVLSRGFHACFLLVRPHFRRDGHGAEWSGKQIDEIALPLFSHYNRLGVSIKIAQDQIELHKAWKDAWKRARLGWSTGRPPLWSRHMTEYHDKHNLMLQALGRRPTLDEAKYQPNRVQAVRNEAD